MRKLPSFALSIVTLSVAMACGDTTGDTITLGAGVGGASPSGGTTGKGGAGAGGKGGAPAGGTGGAGVGGKAGASGGAGVAGAGASGGNAGAAGTTGGKAGASGAGGSAAGSGGKAGSSGASAGSAGATAAGSGGANAGEGGATAGASGAGGSGVSGASGAGGSGGGCAMPSDCPQPPAMCIQATCSMGACGVGPTPQGSPAALQIPGDCQQSVCDGMGAAMPVVDDTDVPNDGNPCTTDTCTTGVPSNPPAASGVMCTGPLGGQVCDGAGACVQCVAQGQCQANETCVLNKCVGGPTLLISEVQTRGSAGGNDELIELYNPTAAPVTFDAMWTLSFRSAVGACAGNAEGLRVTGSGQVIPSHGHILFTGSAYDGPTAADGSSGAGLADAGSLVLRQGATTVDALCFSYDATTLTALTSCATPYVCEGTPVSNLPHNNASSASSNVDLSLDRRPGGVAGNGVDTNDNTADFAPMTPANPQNLASPVTP